MNTFIAVVFPSDDKAYRGMQTLWHMDGEGEITMHGAAIVHRDDMGHIRVNQRNGDAGMRTAIGIGIGALLGLLAGPVGVAAGVAGAAALSVGAAAGVGALAGGAVGAAADAITEQHRDDATYGSFFMLQDGESAVVAEVSEDEIAVVDDAMRPLGGTVHRRKTDPALQAAFGADRNGGYLQPYYDPSHHV
ncbi:Uncharacterized membrane protein [Loktanella fryxellensis]|uniref:Uncharacterized membrane protein n=1 Tax=Loktanella fryxellensis TaxID=245187 RepID=A0A1H8HIV3_9RHOB|nr:hypothetical protein [Loktanella fryxellensis]SEN55458.1 Uncharacterized membrane protein [Loktanella fryxellensis]